ncbi:hypothetical protein BUALT_Bualt19G0092100 [Buddleja alternifolia]|uniref:Uncharacterized protein n=1 Tax=Buddleja alternifolia TaxID=168488 RepID=A0AAV6WAY3_9LAMI|nr:hypothetical protein BUALT_Bualt19G0092100 [Buddleja alternifolia]
MSRIYDNWERLVAAVLKKEEIRQLCLALSISSDSDHNSISDGDSVCLSWGNDYTIWQSPSFRCNIVDWQKGELLGKGTFGAVYEGISE